MLVNKRVLRKMAPRNKQNKQNPAVTVPTEVWLIQQNKHVYMTITMIMIPLLHTQKKKKYISQGISVCSRNLAASPNTKHELKVV